EPLRTEVKHPDAEDEQRKIKCYTGQATFPTSLAATNSSSSAWRNGN
ncbi:uncharacterized protein METZ01_LOCUS91802, partial [marine metagenome]